jgi:hypothetical protein
MTAEEAKRILRELADATGVASAQRKLMAICDLIDEVEAHLDECERILAARDRSADQ